MLFPSLDPEDAALRKCLRVSLRARRRSLSRAEHQHLDSLIARRMAPMLRGARHVAAYLAADGEPDLKSWMARVSRSTLALYLPVVDSEHGLLFRRYRSGDPMRLNRFGIAEPLPRQISVGADALDMLLMPLVGFDRQGGRLGMGGGFYDRALANMAKPPRLIGIAYESQEIETLPLAPWDVRLNCVVTPRETIRCAGPILRTSRHAAGP